MGSEMCIRDSSLTEILAEYGLDDLTYDDVFAFHEDLNDKITFSDLEE